MKNRRETRLSAGKRDSSPYGMWSVGSARGSESGEHEMPVKAIRQVKGVSPSYGLRFGSPWPSRGRKPVHAKIERAVIACRPSNEQAGKTLRTEL
jgi:hypothetical protein